MTGFTLHIPTLKTDRLVLRAPALADFEPHAAMFAAPRSPYVGQRDRARSYDSFARDVADWVLRGVGTWTVCRSGDDLAIGMVGIAQPDAFPEPELGWTLFDGQEGHGYATEAARRVRDWARARLSSLVSYIPVGHVQSVAVAERLGAIPDQNAALPMGDTPDRTHVYRHWSAR
ncbi:MAG: GNAT family N-acetyltransferase [Pseudomonadota bacterium]